MWLHVPESRLAISSSWSSWHAALLHTTLALESSIVAFLTGLALGLLLHHTGLLHTLCLLALSGAVAVLREAGWLTLGLVETLESRHSFEGLKFRQFNHSRETYMWLLCMILSCVWRTAS